MSAPRGELLRAYKELKRPVVGIGKDLSSIECASFGQILANSAHLNMTQGALFQHHKDLPTELTEKALDTMRTKIGTHTLWKTLILPGGNPSGSYNRLQSYLLQIINNSSSELVKALAHERMFLSTELLYRQSANASKNAAFFGTATPTCLHQIYQVFKALAQLIKAPRTQDLERDRFFDQFYQTTTNFAIYQTLNDRIVLAAKDSGKGRNGNRNTNNLNNINFQYLNGHGPNSGQLGADANGTNSIVPPLERPNGGKIKKEQVKLETGPFKNITFPKNLATAAAKISTVEQANQIEQEVLAVLNAAGKDGPSIQTALAKARGISDPVLFIIWTKSCRNCYSGGLGLVPHSIKTCQASGNKCNIVCQICKAKGKTDIHWTSNCPNKK
ncbi:MAG: hypothetical protein CME32_02600 [Gimesia sp.]|nr:hypothetical protein [Gimesia sp.]